MANVTFVDCNGGFMAHGKINNKLMPDALHPNPAGADAERGPMPQECAGPVLRTTAVVDTYLLVTTCCL